MEPNHRTTKPNLAGHSPARRKRAALLPFCGRISAKIGLAVLGLSIFSQEARSQGSYLGESRYLETSAGTGLARMRDIATSPLFYEGLAHRFGVSLAKYTEKVDATTGFAMLNGNLSVDYNEHVAQSALTNISIHHARLYQIFRNGNDRWNFKVGGEANLNGNLRVNRALMNSAVGIEAFPTLFGAFKATKDITRATGRRGREPKKRSLSLRVNASIVGTSIRNGYSYLGIGQVIDKPGLDGVLDDYRVKVFGVNALTTSLDYTFWLKNKNGWRFSYAWEAYKTNKDYADFEMASHTIRVALLFNTKNN